MPAANLHRPPARGRGHALRRLAAALALSLPLAPALAQEAVTTRSATQPGKGRIVVRTTLTLTTYDDRPAGEGRDGDADDDDGREWTLDSTVVYGLSSDASIRLSVPVSLDAERDGPGTSELALGDASLELRYRFLRKDLSAVDTLRAAAIVGLQLPTGSDEDSAQRSFDPYVGLSLTYIKGRHGLGQSLVYTFTTGAQNETFGAPIQPGRSLADLLEFDSAYLYRLKPAAYGSTIEPALYALVELNGVYETNGDTELFISPGLLWEAPRYALEAAVRLPVARDVEHRAERGIGFVVGLRLLF